MKKRTTKLGWILLASLVSGIAFQSHAQTLNVQLYSGISVTGVVNVRYALQATTNLSASSSWVTLTNFNLPANPWLFIDYESPQWSRRFYRTEVLPPAGSVFLAPGPFAMGDTFGEGNADERPVHTVDVSPIFVEQYEVTKALWDEIHQWATNNGYSFAHRGFGRATNHPVQTVSWHDAVKWCNARSERAGKVPAYYTSTAQTTVYRSGEIALEPAFVKWNAGYRLPTEAEWEKAARGGFAGTRFPWATPDTISHTLANYYASPFLPYDVSPTIEWHPAFIDPTNVYTSPVGYFAPNGFGLFDFAGNVWEWCWDWFDAAYYNASPAVDPRGPATGTERVIRGTGWNDPASVGRVAARTPVPATATYPSLGFRCVLPPGGL